MNPAIPADLETIVAHAMAKEPEERYNTSKELADDLRRFLEHKQIQAKRSSVTVRVRKWAKRHRSLVVSAVVLLIAAVVGLSMSTFLISRERAEAVRQRKLADQQRQAAHTAYEKTRRALYVSDLSLAQQAWEDANVGRVVELLGRHRPKPGERDLRGFEWCYLWRACHGYEAVLMHGDPVWSLAVSPNEKLLASGSLDGTIKLWDLQSGTVLHSIQAHTDHVRSLAFSPDGSLLASGGGPSKSPGEIRTWNVAEGSLVRDFKGHTDPVMCVTFSPEGGTLASASVDRTVKTWDAKTGELKNSFEKHIFNVAAVAFSPNGKYLFSGGSDGRLWRWNLESGESYNLVPLTTAPYDLLYSASDNSLITPQQGGEINVWDPTTGELKKTLLGHRNDVVSAAISPDQTLLVSGGQDNTIRLWSMPDGQPLATLKGHSHSVSAVGFLDRGRRIVSGSWDGSLRIWDLSDSQQKTTFSASNLALSSSSLSPDGRRLALAGSNVRFLDLRTGEMLASFEGVRTRYACFLGNGTSFALVRDEGGIEFWDFKTRTQSAALSGHFGDIYSLVVSPDGRILASGGHDNSARLWDIETAQLIATIRNSPQDNSTDAAVLSVAFSPTGEHLALASHDRTIRIVDLRSLETSLILRGHRHAVTSVAFSPNGRLIASGSRDRTVRLWDAETGEEKAVLHGHSGEVLAVAFADEGRTVISGGVDRTVKMWNVEAGELRASFNAHDDAVMSLALSVDGKFLTSADRLGKVRIWRTAEKEETRTVGKSPMLQEERPETSAGSAY